MRTTPGFYPMTAAAFPSDLTDQAWLLPALLLPPAILSGRLRSLDLRQFLIAIVSLVRAGCAWVSGHYLPRNYGPWVHGAPLFSAVVPGRHMGAHPHAIAGSGTCRGRT